MARKRTARQKQEQRIKRYFSRKEQQGYRWTEEVKQHILGLKTVQSLKRWGAEKLLSKATALSPTTGKEVSGTEAMHEYRSMSAKRGWETRRTREYQEAHFDEPIYPEPEEVEAEPEPERDTEKDSLAYDLYHEEWEQKYDWLGADEYETEWTYDTIYQGNIILNQLRATVDSYMPRVGASFLKSLIDSQLAEFGDKFIQALANLDEEIVAEAITLAEYESGDKVQATRQYNKLVNMIRGAMATEEEAREVGEMLDDIDDFESE